MEASLASGPGVIVVAEPSIHDLLSRTGVQWNVQERQACVADMWSALSGGRLDQRSRVLVFSDSLRGDSPDDDSERTQTARALVAMAHAGARVFIVVWRADAWDDFEGRIGRAAAAQGVDPQTLAYHRVEAPAGGRAALDAFWDVLRGEVTFPDDYGPAADAPLTRSGQDASDEYDVPTPDVSAMSAEGPDETSAVEFSSDDLAAAGEADEVRPGLQDVEAPASVEPIVRTGTPPMGTAPNRPSMPPIGAVHDATATAPRGEYPPNASLELLDLPKRPGQTTITVTSSKGGSGKSTASIMLAATIARASADAGTPLSVCLIDLDTRDGQVASLIGKFMPTALNIRVQPVWDEDRIRRNLVRAEGLDIDTLLAPIRPRTADTVGPDFYRTIVRSLQRMYDIIIMDTSVQYLEPLIAEVALGEADEILFVTTLASTAVQGMARALREITAPLDESGLGIPREKIGIIVNQSVANVGMERDQVLAAGLGVPVVGVVPLATKDVLTATNLNRMYALLDHPLLGPAYNELAHACLPNRDMATWTSTARVEPAPAPMVAPPPVVEEPPPVEQPVKRRGLFRR